MKTFEEFKSALKSGELKAELEELAKTVSEKDASEKAESEKDALICEFAKKLGYDVSVEDLAAERAAAKEMSKEELEAVAGGGCSSLDLLSFLGGWFGYLGWWNRVSQ